MAYVVIYDNHGNEVRRFHHTELDAEAIVRAVREATAHDAQASSLDELNDLTLRTPY